MAITSSIVVSQAIYKYHFLWYFCFMIELNHTSRFDTAYARIVAQKKPIDLTHTLDTSPYGISVSLAGAEGVHIDDQKRLTSKAIGMLISTRISDDKLGTFGKVTDRVELYRDAEGEVISNYSGRADLYNKLSAGLNHGYTDTEFAVPYFNADIALNSALVAVETALDQYDLET